MLASEKKQKKHAAEKKHYNLQVALQSQQLSGETHRMAE